MDAAELRQQVAGLPSVFIGVFIGFSLGLLVSRQISKKTAPPSVEQPAIVDQQSSAAASSSSRQPIVFPDSSSDEDDDNEEYSSGDESDDEGDYPYQEEHKMVLVVCTELKMKPGKVAAQCCHAAIGAYRRAWRQTPAAVQFWERTAAAKIALQVKTQQELVELEQAARRAGLPAYLVVDAGRTQIPAGSRTVLGIGPAPRSAIDQVTGSLKLF